MTGMTSRTPNVSHSQFLANHSSHDNHTSQKKPILHIITPPAISSEATMMIRHSAGFLAIRLRQSPRLFNKSQRFFAKNSQRTQQQLIDQKYEKFVVKGEILETSELDKFLWNISRAGDIKRTFEVMSVLKENHPQEMNSKRVAAALNCIISSPKVKDKGQQAERLFEEAMTYPSVERHKVLYNTVMNAYSKTEGGVDQVRAWLERMKADGVEPDHVSYTTLIIANEKDTDNAQRAFEEYKRQSKDGKFDGGPYAAMVRAWSVSSRADAVERAEQVMEEMLAVGKGKIPVHAFTSLLKTLCSHPGQNYGEKALAWCNRFKEATGKEPDLQLYSSVLHVFGSSGRPDAGRQADRIVTTIGKLMNEGNPKDVVIFYNNWMNCYTKSGDPGAVQRVMDILSNMEERYLSGASRGQPDALSYSAAIQAWAKSGLPTAFRQAEKLFQRMQLHRTGESGVVLPPIEPNLQCFEALMDAYARHGDFPRVLALLEELESNNCLSTSVRSYGAALLALSRSSHPDKSKLAQEMLSRMMKSGHLPNTFCYTSAIACQNNHDELAPERALEILEQVKRSPMCTPDVYTYTAVITAFARRGNSEMAKKLFQEASERYDKTKGPHMKPNIRMINAVLRAYQQVGTVEAAQEANEMLTKLISTESGHRLQIETFGSVMAAWAQLGRVGQAFDVMEKLRSYAASHQDPPDLKINEVIYTTLLNAYANSTEPDSAIQAEAILAEMHQDPNATPNSITFTTVIEIFVKHGTEEYRQKARELLAEMENKFIMFGDQKLKPLPKAYELLSGLEANGSTAR
jgi:pentatricopeptide repeat protein